jgi:hypothetical protein
VAESPSHKFGQIVGNLIEEIVLPGLQNFCEQRGLYLDTQGLRPGVRKGRKVSWTDRYGNSHDLDFVIEKGGSAKKLGRPVAFIEAAWRRYTKHSRNKAQEIQGAILPIAEEYAWDGPFLGAVVAGVFTIGSLEQMKSVGFEVLYLPYGTIVNAFASAGIDTQFDESTPDEMFSQCVEQIEGLSGESREAIKEKLLGDNNDRITEFFSALERRLDRMIERIVVIPTFGNEYAFESMDQALRFLDGFDETNKDGSFQRYEVIVRFSNGDEIKGSFNSKERTKEFMSYVGA